MSDLISLAIVDDEPRVDSRLIASQLGVLHKNTRELIQQYQTDFEEFGKVPFKTEASGKTNQQQKFALLNEDQSYLLLTYAQNTPQARELKKKLVRLFGEHRRAVLPPYRPSRTRKALPSGLTIEQQDAVKALVKVRVEALPKAAQAKAAITCWSSIKSKFGVSYKEVPAAEFVEVLSLVARLELVEETPKALPLDIHYPLESAAPPLGQDGLNFHAFLNVKDWIDPNWELLMRLKDAGYNVEGPIYSHQAKLHIIKRLIDGIVDKMVETLKVNLPYAPIYLR